MTSKSSQEMETQDIQSQNDMKLDDLLGDGPRIGVGRPTDVNPVPTMIANQLPAIPDNQNYTSAHQNYKRLAESGEMAVTFPVFKKSRRGGNVLKGLKSYSLGQFHRGLKRTVNTKDAIKQHARLMEMASAQDSYGRQPMQNVVARRHGGTLEDYAEMNKATHDIAERLQNEVRELPGSRLVGSMNPLNLKRRREISHAGQVHDTTVPHPANDSRKRVGIDGREKRLGGGRKTRKHRRKHKRKTRKRKRKRKTKKRKHHRRKHKRKTRRR
jgi:hypothetical protein